MQVVAFGILAGIVVVVFSRLCVTKPRFRCCAVAACHFTAQAIVVVIITASRIAVSVG